MRFPIAILLIAAGCATFAQVQVTKAGATVKQRWTVGQAVRYNFVAKAEMGPGQPFATRTPVTLTATKATATATNIDVLFGTRSKKLVSHPTMVARVTEDAFPFGAVKFSSKPVAIGATWVQTGTYPGMTESQKVRWTFVRRTKVSGVAVSEFRAEFQAESERATVVGRGVLRLDEANGLIRTWDWAEELTSFATTSVYSGTSSRRTFNLTRTR